jgi:predicted Zn-dependent peptidase
MTKSAPEGDFHRYDLSPGFRLYVGPDRRFKTSHIAMFAHRTLDREATAVSLLESVLQRGCHGYPTMRSISQFAESLYGASFDTDVLKIGERQILALTMRLLNDRFAPRRTGSLERGLDFLCRCFSKPILERGLLKRDYVEQERLNLDRFLRGLINDRMGYAMIRCTELMCAREPYGINEYGSLKDLPSIDEKRLTEAHQRIRAESPIDLFVAGEHDPDLVARRVRSAFGALIERRLNGPLPPPVDPDVKAVREVRESLQVEQAKLILGFRTRRRLADPLFPAFAFYNGLLGAFPHSRLFADLREKHGLCYQAHSFVEASKGLLFVVLGIDAANHVRARDLVLKHVESLRRGEFTDEEFEKTRQLILHAVRSREDSPSGKIYASLEGLVNGRILSTAEALRRVGAVRRDEIAEAARDLVLDTVYLLSNP